MSAARCTPSRSTAAPSTSARTGSGRRSGACSAWPTELGVEVEKQYLDGRHLITLGGERHTFTGLIPLTSVYGTVETILGVARVELRRRLVRRAEPWRSRSAARLDSFTLAHWMRRARSDEARAMWTLTARTVFGAEPSELSFLYFLWYAQCAGGVMQLTDFEGGAQDAAPRRRHAAAVRPHRCRARRRRAARLAGNGHQARRRWCLDQGGEAPDQGFEGDRRGVARARRPDRLRPGAAGARRARPANADGRLHEGRCDLRPRVVARPGALGACVRGPRAGADDGRREPAGRRARSPRRFRDGRARTCGRDARAGRAPACRARGDGRRHRPGGGEPAQLPRLQLARGTMEPRWPGGADGPRDAHGARPAAVRARRPAALGGHRHRDRVERLHGGRDPGWASARPRRSAR